MYQKDYKKNYGKSEFRKGEVQRKDKEGIAGKILWYLFLLGVVGASYYFFTHILSL